MDVWQHDGRMSALVTVGCSQRIANGSRSARRSSVELQEELDLLKLQTRLAVLNPEATCNSMSGAGHSRGRTAAAVRLAIVDRTTCVSHKASVPQLRQRSDLIRTHTHDSYVDAIQCQAGRELHHAFGTTRPSVRVKAHVQQKSRSIALNVQTRCVCCYNVLSLTLTCALSYLLTSNTQTGLRSAPLARRPLTPSPRVRESRCQRTDPLPSTPMMTLSSQHQRLQTASATLQTQMRGSVDAAVAATQSRADRLLMSLSDAMTTTHSTELSSTSTTTMTSAS